MYGGFLSEFMQLKWVNENCPEAYLLYFLFSYFLFLQFYLYMTDVTHIYFLSSFLHKEHMKPPITFGYTRLIYDDSLYGILQSWCCEL